MILDEADYARWLDRAIPGKDVADLLAPRSAEGMVAVPVSRAVNNARNDGPECIEGMTE